MLNRSSVSVSILWFLAVVVLIFLLSLAGMWAWYVAMPGESVNVRTTSLTSEEEARVSTLVAHVTALAEDIGERHLRKPDSLDAAADYIDEAFQAAGVQVLRQPFNVHGRLAENIIGVVAGTDAQTTTKNELLVIGAHYDSAPGTPGADDNASGVAVLIELARKIQAAPAPMTVHFVAFANEEAPYFGTGGMGSVQYVDRARAEDMTIRGMFSLEMLGYFTDESASQTFPTTLLDLVYPTTGNFVAFVGNSGSRRLVRNAISGFRTTAKIPSEGMAAPQVMGDIARSDNWSFWQMGIPALMVTDTANFRNPHYHRTTDRIETLDFTAMSQIVTGLDSATRSVVREARRKR